MSKYIKVIRNLNIFANIFIYWDIKTFLPFVCSIAAIVKEGISKTGGESINFHVFA